MKEDEFKEIQLKDLSDRHDSSPPRVLNIPLPVYKIGHLGFAPQQITSMSGGLLQPGPHAQMSVAVNEREIRFGTITKQGKVVRWASILDMLAVFLYLVALLYPLLLLLPFPLLGYCAGRRINRVLSLCQLLYLAITLVLRIVLCGVIQFTAFQVIQAILIVLNAIEIILFIRFYRALGTLSTSEREELLTQQSVAKRGMMFNPQPLHSLHSN